MCRCEIDRCSTRRRARQARLLCAALLTAVRGPTRLTADQLVAWQAWIQVRAAFHKAGFADEEARRGSPRAEWAINGVLVRIDVDVVRARAKMHVQLEGAIESLARVQ